MKGWGVDHTGKPTDNPEEILFGGGLSPLGGELETGGYKGYGLAMMVEARAPLYRSGALLTRQGAGADEPDGGRGVRAQGGGLAQGPHGRQRRPVVRRPRSRARCGG
jgi:hypothetical protein